ncbi:Asx homology domain-containing protein [Amylocystis lapponica]|nr:Asx homology domain-containing protein [Amylocystis lapponica]
MSEPATSSGRPRRSTRQPAKAPVTITTEEPTTPAAGKRPRKTQDTEKASADKLQDLLTSKKSKLTKIDISDVLNYHNFLDLSPQAQQRLVSLLPPTAFSTFRPSVPPTHIDYRVPISSSSSEDDMEVDLPPEAGSSAQPPGPQLHQQERSTASLDPAIFTSPFFLSAAHTFQDHLYLGWFGQKAQDEVAQFEQGVRDGSLRAEWKDEVWVRDHPAGQNRGRPLDLTALVKRGLLQEGDVLSYMREFPQLGLVVEKDLLVRPDPPDVVISLTRGHHAQIDTVYARSKTLVVLLSPGATRSLAPSLLVAGAQVTDEHVLSMEDIADPGVLENGILDVDGRVSKAERQAAGAGAPPHGPSGSNAVPSAHAASHNAWRSFTVWRWREEMRDAVDMQAVQERGGRERFGTLFYLRACCSE